MSDFSSWAPPADPVSLGENEIHIWRAYLDPGDTALHYFETILASDEKLRAGRFIFQPDRNRFITARGILRDLLGRYLNRAAADLEFGYQPEGKPFLRNSSGQSVQFNISHAHGLALFAFARGRELGVDVELVRPDFAGDDIAARFFSADEIAELRALPSSLRTEGFFLCWTLKEAYVKARGGGLNIPLNSFHVSFTPGKPERLRSQDSSRWSLCSLRPQAGYVGALVAEGSRCQPRCFDWTPLNASNWPGE
jgi:4'-phosphopantetheinyl transferase